MMPRRAFFATAATAVRWAIGVALAAPGIAFVLSPLSRARQRRAFLKLAQLDAIPNDDPVCRTVTADRSDAYIHYPPGPIGRVWVRRAESADGEGRLQCFQATCPHLGCMIEYSSARGMFHCPCHASGFDKNGHRLSGPAPRDMDSLPVQVTDPDENGHRWVEVEYKEFQTGVAEQRAIG